MRNHRRYEACVDTSKTELGHNPLQSSPQKVLLAVICYAKNNPDCKNIWVLGVAVRKYCEYVVLFWVLLLSSFFFNARAEAAKGSDAPIRIEADRMISQEQKNSVLFVGNVDARQDDIVIRADEMTVFYTPQDQKNAKDKKGSTQITKLVCKGNVEITRGDWVGTGKQMNYFAPERKVVLTGDAKAWQGQNFVTGETITYFLDEGRSTVTQNPKAKKRIKAVLYPGKNKKKKKKKTEQHIDGE